MAQSAAMVETAKVIQAMQSPDNATRSQAEQAFANMKQQGPDQLFQAMMTLLLKESGSEPVLRTQVAVLMRRMVDRSDENQFCWTHPQVQQPTREGVKAGLLSVLEGEETKLATQVRHVIATLSGYLFDNKNPPFSGGWNELLPVLMKLCSSQNDMQREVSYNIISDLAAELKGQLMANQGDFGQLLQKGLGDSSASVKAAAVSLICEVAQIYEKSEWQPMQPIVAMVLQTIQQVAQEEDALRSCLEAMIDAGTVQPLFFKNHLKETFELMVTLCKARDNLDESLRAQALEFIICVVEEKPKMCLKQVPDCAAVVISCCMEMMAEAEDDDDWVTRMYDDEGDEDDNTAFDAGQSSIDRFVDKVGIEMCSQALFGAIGQFVKVDQWQGKLAAMTAIKQTCEYIEEDHVVQCAELLMAHIAHPHMRVRYTALEGIGQLAIDQCPHFQEKTHQGVVPALMNAMDDPVDRVAAMAMSAFVNYGDEVDDTHMMEYSHALMDKLKAKLQSQHRGVRQEALTSIAVIAGVLESEFGRYYDDIMPVVKHCVHTCTGQKERMLRGKAFECMSLLGLAVGKQKFAPDVTEAMNQMSAQPMEADDVQKEYIKEAMERIAKALKQDFATFLPALLPNLLQTCQLPTPTEGAAESDEETYTVKAQDGKSISIHSVRFTDMQHALQLILAFVQETSEAYAPFIVQTAQQLMPLLETRGEVNQLCAELRTEAFSIWAEMIKVAHAQNQAAVVQELLNNFITKVLSSVDDDDDTDCITEAARGLQAVLEKAGPNCIDERMVEILLQFLQKKMTEAFERKQNQTADDDDDDGSDEDDGEDEMTCRISLNACYGSLMKANTDVFCRIGVNVVIGCLKQWQNSKDPQDKVLAYNLVCDFLENLGERSVDAWPLFMDGVVSTLSDKNAELRTATAFAINLAARLPKFAEYQGGNHARTAYSTLVNLVQRQTSIKNKDKDAKMALDNAVAALVVLSIHMPQMAPGGNVDAVWELCFERLPLRGDEDESQKLNQILFDRVTAECPMTLGANQSRLPKLFGLFADVHNSELVLDELKAKISGLFKAVPAAKLQAMEGQFTDKQRKKIQKIVMSS